MIRPYTLIAIAACAVSATFSYRAGADSAPISEAASETVDGAAEAVFAGGCFWCVESDFDKVDGVLSTVSGYTGGRSDNPTYKTHGVDGHYEAVRVSYDPTIVTYDELVEYFWRHVDPTDAGGQFCDRGDSYRTAIFVADDAQRNIAEASKDALESSGVLGLPVVTPVEELGEFWPAETYHQDYYLKNPVRYKFYRTSCGRDRRVDQVWANATPES
ncbi:MAG: peptide-methionine (S)-S-oxide reductase MsrA [Pseudomonadota bacterium]